MIPKYTETSCRFQPAPKPNGLVDAGNFHMKMSNSVRSEIRSPRILQNLPKMEAPSHTATTFTSDVHTLFVLTILGVSAQKCLFSKQKNEIMKTSASARYGALKFELSQFCHSSFLRLQLACLRTKPTTLEKKEVQNEHS